MKDKTDFDTLEDTANHLTSQVMHVFMDILQEWKKKSESMRMWNIFVVAALVHLYLYLCFMPDLAMLENKVAITSI